MRDVLLIALFALGGAAVAGLAGAGVLMFLRRRSVAVSLIVVAVVAVTAMLAGTLSVAWAMFLSPHDLWVVTVVVAMAAVVSFVTAMVLGRWVVARSRDLARATREFGDGGDFAAPAVPATAELADLARELAATSERLAASRQRERALESSRRNWSPGSPTTCAPRSPGCAPWPKRWRTASPPTRPATTVRSARRSSG